MMRGRWTGTGFATGCRLEAGQLRCVGGFAGAGQHVHLVGFLFVLRGVFGRVSVGAWSGAALRIVQPDRVSSDGSGAHCPLSGGQRLVMEAITGRSSSVSSGGLAVRLSSVDACGCRLFYIFAGSWQRLQMAVERHEHLIGFERARLVPGRRLTRGPESPQFGKVPFGGDDALAGRSCPFRPAPRSGVA